MMKTGFGKKLISEIGLNPRCVILFCIDGATGEINIANQWKDHYSSNSSSNTADKDDVCKSVKNMCFNQGMYVSVTEVIELLRELSSGKASVMDGLIGKSLNPIRSGLFQTVNDPGGGALKAPPPYDLENYCVNLHHIIHVNFTRCFSHDPIRIFQKFAILTILQRFQNKR